MKEETAAADSTCAPFALQIGSLNRFSLFPSELLYTAEVDKMANSDTLFCLYFFIVTCVYIEDIIVLIFSNFSAN